MFTKDKYKRIVSTDLQYIIGIPKMYEVF